MNISGIRPSTGIYDYNITKEKQTEDIAAQQADLEQAAAARQETEKVSGRETRPVRQTETAFDYARKYEPDRTYEMKGTESALEDLDMEQAISDMRKDQLLKQYQFFVGSSRNVRQDGKTADIIPYENFEL